MNLILQDAIAPHNPVFYLSLHLFFQLKFERNQFLYYNDKILF